MRLLQIIVYLVAAISLGCGGCDDLGDPTNDACGNGVREAAEVCDGSDLAGETCISQGFEEGELRCAPGCGGYVVADCSGGLTFQDCDRCGASETCDDGRCVPVCGEEPWASDGEHDFDIATRVLRIELQWDGATMPPASEIRSRGELVLTGAVPWEPLIVQIPSEGEAAVEVPVYHERYELRWRPGEEVYAAEVDYGETLVIDGTESLGVVTFDVGAWSTTTGTLEFPEGYDVDPGIDRVVFSNTLPNIGPIVSPLQEDGSYIARLREGPHEVWWVREDPPVAVHVGTMEERSERFDLELPLRYVDFTLTVEGATPTFPSDKTPTILLLADDLGPPLSLGQYQRRSGTWVDLDEQGRGRAMLRAGSYAATLHGSVPPFFGSYPLGDVSADSSDQSFDIDLAAVSGEITRNGGRLPGSSFSGEQGLLTFVGRDGGFLSIPIGDRSHGEFETLLPVGEWDVQIGGNYWTSSLPLVPVTIERGVFVGADGVSELEMDVPAVRFAGSVTANGARLPDDPEVETRGTLEIRRVDEPIWHSVPLSPTGPAGFELVLSPGEYEFGIVRWWFGTDPNAEPPGGVLPFGEWFGGSVDITAATRRDIDVRLYRVEFDLSRNGEPVPEGSRIWLEDREARRVARSVLADTTGRPLSTTLYPGVYRLILQIPGEDPFVVKESFVVARDDRFEFDLRDIEVAGRLTVSGDEVDRNDPMGELEFLRVPSVASESTSATLATPGSTYRHTLAEGHYNVLFRPGESVGGTVVPDHPGVAHQACLDPRIEP